LTARHPAGAYPWLAMGGVAIVTFVLLAGRGVQVTDEAWFLWVTERLARGDVLYRDVYSVTTPIAFWLSLGAVKPAGTQLLVVRALSVGCFVVAIELLRRIVARRGLSGLGQVLLIVVIWVLGSPVSHRVALYSGLAITLTAAVWFCLAGRGPNRSRGRLAVIGVLAGLSFQTKPNVGALALLAVALVLATEQRPAGDSRPRVLDVALVAAGFVVAAGAVLVPVAATGGLRGYIDYVFLNKGSYLDAGVSYLSQVGDAARLATRLGASTATRVLTVTILVPIVAAGAIVVGFIRARPRVRVLEPAAFTVVGLVAVYPRVTLTHIAAATPLLITGAFLTWRSARPVTLPRAWSKLAVGLAAVALVLAFGAVASRSIDGLTGDHAPMPRLAGTPVDARRAARLRSQLQQLRAATGGKVFIVKSDAGFLYLGGDLTDPTPFDIPERTDFGPHGEDDAIRVIERSRVRFVCLHPDSGHPKRRRASLSPLRLERYVRRHLVATGDFGTCLLYERRNA
jgi:hypothetical protein